MECHALCCFCDVAYIAGHLYTAKYKVNDTWRIAGRVLHRINSFPRIRCPFHSSLYVVIPLVYIDPLCWSACVDRKAGVCLYSAVLDTLQPRHDGRDFR